ncbi:hypothetical protein WN944_001928 [Citrus x changshan-huyou]|uniref:Uncharacterized protein n=1 Tax=Citrus x changshan-huyou TaxID=2935761 RepID=A0AAP0QRP5_9ROSI
MGCVGKTTLTRNLNDKLKSTSTQQLHLGTLATIRVQGATGLKKGLITKIGFGGENGRKYGQG